MPVKVLSRTEKYRMLTHIFNHIVKKDEAPVKKIYEQFQDEHLGFVVC